MMEIRWHGRGGQGTVTAAKVLAESCLSLGKHVQAFPEYGPERAGAPIRAYNRINDTELRMHCPVLEPQVVAIVDATLIEAVDVTGGAIDDAIFVVNTTKDPSVIRKALGAKDSQKVYTVDASKIALDCIGRALPNSPILAAVCSASGLVEKDALLSGIKKSFGKKFSQKIIEGNIEAATRGYTEVKVG